MITVELFHVIFPQARPLSISFNTWEQRDTYLLIARCGKLEGIGAGNPFKPITGDSGEELVKEAWALGTIPLAPEKDGIEKLHGYLKDRVSSSSLQSAIDGAYHDLLGKIYNRPVYGLYSEKAHEADNSITVFVDSIENTVAEAGKIYKMFPELKILKIKLKGTNDMERVRAIKNIFPPDMKFVLDANQAYPDPKEAVSVLSEIGSELQNVILVEEPCTKGDLESLRYVSDNLSNMLVFADESATTTEAVEKIIKAKAAHGINIKLQKAGGIFPAMEIAGLCRENNLKIMVGAMIEDTVGLTAALHFAAANSNVILTDLDTDIDLPEYISGGSSIKGSRRYLTETSGLGLSLDWNLIKRLTENKELIINKIFQD